MPPSFDTVGSVIGALALASIAAEWAWSLLTGRGLARDAASNLMTFLVGEAVRLATATLRVGVFVAAEHLSPWRRSMTVVDAVGCYLLVDLVLYGWHRLLHETRVGWAFHSVHHSSSGFELTLGGRVHWLQRLVDDVIYAPLALLGFSPTVLVGCLVVNRLAQFWPHTEAIGRLPWFDGWLNTPSNHRVHHQLKPGGPRANYGSNFMLWDRLFGTYEAETRPLQYGTDLGDVGTNPLRIQLAGLRAWASFEPDALIRLLFSAWFVVWAVTYARYFGFSVFVWSCCLGQWLVLVGLWARARFVLSLSALLVLGPQLTWGLDVLLRLVSPSWSFGAAATLFDAQAPTLVRVLTLFHGWTPLFLLWLFSRQPYQPRALWVALLAAPVLVLAGAFAGGDINHADLGIGFATLGYVGVFIIPTHFALRWACIDSLVLARRRNETAWR